ncbi:DUF3108 domain-containing protein [Granulosicoccus sp. 3-233]|uniref:DUF3108 domain-containing protein n=1 Tax=Granulosicoccus sp. 3-233 TaxID=3417969 RepID=UPI003D353C34
MTRLPLHGALNRTVQPAIAAILLCCFSLLGTASAQSIKAGDIAPFEVVYEVGNNLISAGTARLTLSREGDLWHYSLSTKPRGVFKLAGKGRIDEQSTFVLAGSGDDIQLQPQSYRYRQDNERRRQVDAEFDWDDQMITHVYRGNELTETFNEPVLDRLTATVFIMNALRNDFQEAEMSIFDSGKIKQVAFANMGEEMLSTPLGNIETIRVVNQNASGGSRETSTWFAPSLDYLPIKIEHLKRGELVARLSLLSLDNRVTSLELGGAMPVDEDSELVREEAERLLQEELDLPEE